MEIKLRAFDESSGEFAYSADVEQDYYFWCFDRNGQIACYYEVEKGGNHEEPPEIVPEEVSGPYELWTDRQDKGGKDVYEGDILGVKKNISMNMVVKWKKGTAGFDLAWLDGSTFRVIGNIHENPELVKE